MRLRSLAAITSVVTLVVLLLATIPCLRADEPKKPAAVDPFGLAKVWQFHLTIDAKEYQAMQPAGGGGFGFGGFGKPPEKKPGDRETHRSVFGTDFPVVH